MGNPLCKAIEMINSIPDTVIAIANNFEKNDNFFQVETIKLSCLGGSPLFGAPDPTKLLPGLPLLVGALLSEGTELL